MIQAATVYTYEIDSCEQALSDINAQLNRKLTRKTHTVGILLCDPDFVESGVVDYLCTHLDFPVAGITTASQTTEDEAGDLLLTMMILTADDIAFSVGMTAPLDDAALSDEVRKIASTGAAQSDTPPAMGLLFPPLIEDYPGDAYVEAFEAQFGKIPLFGSLAVDDSIAFERCMTMYNGLSSRTALAYILMYGPVKPRFVIATVSGKGLLPYTGEITKADGERVLAVNDLPVKAYFEGIGLTVNGQLHEGVQFIPFMMDITKAADYDGVPVVRAMYRFDDDGAALCRGKMYEKSVFTLGVCSVADVLETTLEQVQHINDMDNIHAVIMFSCIVRRMAFGVKPLTELEAVKDAVDGGFPFIMGYSGGEICPTSMRMPGAANRFHNYSFIACIL